MTERVETETWYAACYQCSAKWFSHFRHATCVRCGGDSILVTQESPPWHATQYKCKAIIIDEQEMLSSESRE